jgi:hypothetical protein
MEQSKTQLRHDSPSYPPFLMIHRPPDAADKRRRITEWVLAIWLNELDSNILGIRRADEERDGDLLSMIHIAIPLAYQRKQLARTLCLGQIEDDQSTPRVNLVSSTGFDKPHSFIRVPAELILSKFMDALESDVLSSKEINDRTLKEYERIIDDPVRLALWKEQEEDARLRAGVRKALAVRNAAIDSNQIQILVHKKAREKWVKIRDVEESQRGSLSLVIEQAGIRISSSPEVGVNGHQWTILFTALEAKKLLS